MPFSAAPKLKVVGTNNDDNDEVLKETLVAVSELLVAAVVDVFSRSSATVSGRVVLRVVVVADTDVVVVAGNKVVSPTGLFVSVVETYAASQTKLFSPLYVEEEAYFGLISIMGIKVKLKSISGVNLTIKRKPRVS